MREVKCPECGEFTPLKEHLVAQPLGSFSLSGTQLKFSAREVQAAFCTCGWTAQGHLEQDTFVVEEGP